MKGKKFLFILISILVLSFAFACNRDETDNPPTNEQTDPSENKYNSNPTTDEEQDIKSDTSNLTKEDALSLEEEYMNRILPPREDGSQKVKDYDTKEELIDHISEIANRDLVIQFVDNYYNEKSDGLYIIAKDGPTTIYEDKPYDLKQVTDEKYNLIQEAEDNLRGKYKFTVEITRENERWIINNRIFDKK